MGRFLGNDRLVEFKKERLIAKAEAEKVIMSVHADGLMRKANRQMKENFKQTGLYETNIQRQKRESKLENQSETRRSHEE